MWACVAVIVRVTYLMISSISTVSVTYCDRPPVPQNPLPTHSGVTTRATFSVTLSVTIRVTFSVTIRVTFSMTTSVTFSVTIRVTSA